ncbi:MAG: ABC transporter substrate-binding protein, partial [Coriobacteriia bacterium]|nr:ABC transporter substrate-binding protein [Coriobacteriia bacterium]
EFMSNVDLRKAISLAVNRQAIADTVYEGTRIPATGPVPEGILGFQADAWEFNRYDLELAKEYLDKAGFPEGEGLPEIKLSFNSGAGHEDVMAIVQSDLAKIGVTATFDPHEWAEYSGTFLNN